MCKSFGRINVCGSSQRRSVGKFSFLEKARNLFLYRSVWTVDPSPSVLCGTQLLIKTHSSMHLMP